LDAALRDELMQRIEKLEVNINNRIMLLEKNLKEYVNNLSRSLEDDLSSALVKVEEYGEKLGQEHLKLLEELRAMKTMLKVLLIFSVAELLLLAALLLS